MEGKWGMHILSKGAQPILFDIVAIHGLNGDPFKTWTHKETDVLWLRDLLPEELPNACIMTYGYNAIFKSFTTHQDLRTIAKKLLTELIDVRGRGGRSRPIVFICHSLGGIIAKKALLIGCSDEEAEVQCAVKAILFLGTPHNGTNLARLAKVVANIFVASSPLGATMSFMASLKKDSEILLEITEDFTKRRKILQFISFYETEMTYIAPFYKRLVVEKHSAVLNTPDEITIGQPTDHRQIVRFGSSKSITFRPVLSRLKEIEARIKADLYAATNIAIDTLQLMESNLESAHENESARVRSKIPLDIPIASCSLFLGRNDALDQIQRFFFDLETTKSRRIFTVCGLGGTGKTQLALQYISHFAHRYKTGVMLINAISRISVDADFSRIHDLLHLKDGNNKVSSLKHWLAREDHSQWLMVFDNADDLASLRLETYFPSNWSGHILLTTRDQDAIGSVAQEGILLDTLASDDAVRLLLETAAIRQPSKTDVECARDIVGHLGALPLALDQAGAFMRSRQKSPKQYHDLFVRAQYDLLGYKPRLSSSNETVLSTWELNFQQIEHDPCRAADLLLLFSFLSPSRIEELVLYRGVSPQKRWGMDGEVSEVPADAEGIKYALIELIRNEMKFDTAIEKLRSFSFISSQKDNNGLRIFSVHPLLQYCVAQRVDSSVAKSWNRQAILLICHAFPRNRYLEPTNGELGRAMLPQLSHVFAAFDSLPTDQEDSMLHREIAATSIVASRFSDKSWKMNCLARANEALKVTDGGDLNADLVYRESCLLRMAGDFEKSERRLKDFQVNADVSEATPTKTLTKRNNAQRADIIISSAENLIDQQRFQDAIIELKRWEPMQPPSPSTLESIALRARDITLAKILRYQGQFYEAQKIFETALEKSLSDDFFEGSGWYRVMLSNLADLYCELGEPEKGEIILKKELEPMIKNGTQILATGIRLQLSLVETFIQRARYDIAKNSLLKLEHQCLQENNLNLTTKKYLFQHYIGLARICHYQSDWDEALKHWRSALATIYGSMWKMDCNIDLVQMSIAHILYRKGDTSQSQKILSQVNPRINSEPRIYWIAGFNSSWYDHICKCLRNECSHGDE